MRALQCVASSLNSFAFRITTEERTKVVEGENFCRARNYTIEFIIPSIYAGSWN